MTHLTSKAFLQNSFNSFFKQTSFSALPKVVRLMLVLMLAQACCTKAFAQTWGDQGNGTYINPILNADYSDPDVIRVGEKYYMVCSEFHFMGMPVLESDDMVNWKIISQVYSKIDFPEYDSSKRYGAGAWAPSIRFHDGKFWVYFCTRNEGLFMTTAEKPEGPWAPLTHVKNVQRWEDPCPFWDDDGKAYLGHSMLGAGPIIVHKMSPDGTKILDDGVTVYTGHGAEGTKFHKLNGYYYLSIPEGGVSKGWQTVLRSKTIYGPYEKKVVLERGSTNINGPHQGALVETPKGDWWFYHFQSNYPIGRVLHLQPVVWHDGWPVVGIDIDRNGIGEPVYVWKKPDVGKAFPINLPQTDDEFNAGHLGLQWGWNHNPVDSAWSLIKEPGFLALHALKATGFMAARNTVTQKVIGDISEAITELDVTKLEDGGKAGMCSMSDIYCLIGVRKKNGLTYIFYDNNGKGEYEEKVKTKKIYLKVELKLSTHKNRFYYSLDNKNYTPFGDYFETRFGNWKGTRIGLFNYNEVGNGGTALFNWFRYFFDGPKQPGQAKREQFPLLK
jgi:beta-xylosidase